MSHAIDDVIAERVRQDDKWGEQNHDAAIFLVLLAEEVGEVAQEVLGLQFGSCAKGAEGEGYRKELVHVAAVAVAAIEAFDRRERTAG